jgi:hypothetical protein
MITIHDRVEKIHTPEDAEKQITLAKQYAMRLRAEAKKQKTLAEKVSSQEKVKLAERVMRDLRRLIWEIEDVLAVGKPATSVLKN